MAWAVFIVLGVLAADLLIRLFFARIILGIFERKPPFNVESFDAPSHGQPVSTQTADGLTLRGSLYQHPAGTARGLVLFCPELDGSHTSSMWYCAGLAEAGFDVLSFDFRNQGESDYLPGYAPLHWLTEHELTDVRAALEFIRGREDLRDLPLSLHGVSRGASAALVATSQTDDVRACSCDGLFSVDKLMLHYTERWAAVYVPGWIARSCPQWHLRGTLRLARWMSQRRTGRRYVVLERWLGGVGARPVLLMAGERDSYVPPELGRSLVHDFPPDAAELWVVPRAKHNMARHVDPEGYDRRLVELHTQGLPPDARSRRASAALAGAPSR